MLGGDKKSERQREKTGGEKSKVSYTKGRRFVKRKKEFWGPKTRSMRPPRKYKLRNEKESPDTKKIRKSRVPFLHLGPLSEGARTGGRALIGYWAEKGIETAG